MVSIYMLEFQPLQRKSSSVKLYIGATRRQVNRRVEEHILGRGAACVREAARRHGRASIKLLWTIPNVPWEAERILKSQRNHKRFLSKDKAIKLLRKHGIACEA